MEFAEFFPLVLAAAAVWVGFIALITALSHFLAFLWDFVDDTEGTKSPLLQYLRQYKFFGSDFDGSDLVGVCGLMFGIMFVGLSVICFAIGFTGVLTIIGLIGALLALRTGRRGIKTARKTLSALEIHKAEKDAHS